MAETLMRMYETMSETEQKELYDFALFLLSRNEEKAKPENKSMYGVWKNEPFYMAPDFDEPIEDFADYTRLTGF